MVGVIKAFGIDEETQKSFVNSCTKGSCTLKTEGIKRPYKIIDLDKPGSPLGNQKKRCDYLLLVGGQKRWVMPIELKGGKISVTDTAAQLKAGAQCAEEKFCQESEFNFRPILVCCSIRSFKRKQLRSCEICVLGKKERIQIVRCGKELTSVREFKFLS